MKKLFNKTFFKFTAGFVSIVAVAVFSVFILGAYQASNIVGTENVQASEF